MSSTLVHVGILVGVALVLFIGLVSVIHSLVVAHRVHLLSIKVAAHGLDTLQHVQLMSCEACQSKRHVHLYRYGSDKAMQTMYLCYLCVPRLERALEQVGHGSAVIQGGSSQRKGQP